MSKVRDLLRIYIIIMMIITHSILITRTAVDFSDVSNQSALIRPIYSLSNYLIKPFEGTFQKTSLGGGSLNYEAILAMVFYTELGIILLILLRILFKLNLDQKAKSLTNLFFAIIESFLCYHLILLLLNANNSNFSSFLEAFTSIFSAPAMLIEAFTGELVEELKVVVGMIFLGVIWFTFYKVVDLVIDMLKKRQRVLPSSVEEKRVEYESKVTPKPEIKPEAQAPISEQQVQEVQPAQVQETIPQVPEAVLEATPQAVSESKPSILTKVKKFVDDIARKDTGEDKSPFEGGVEKSKGSESEQSPLGG